ncbi:translation initiation factor IF-2 [Aminivibrio sp.]|uniref:translation initiation factor IF-2 n=1 Tax=Aminivibrio sp. TaxID=1872489 RepID=UPI001A5CD9A7|nr:translation initiation factor IF-2 [Aminivibrio sp.]MBL3539250.1 translation initiation factor IF-2 [Aminivibrio sp.]
MSKIRVYELAKLLGKSNRELLNILIDLGVDVKSHMSSIDNDIAQLVEDSLRGAPGTEGPGKKEEERSVIKTESCEVSKGSTVKAVAQLIGISPAEAVKCLISAGLMVPADSPVDEKCLKVLQDAYNVVLTMACEDNTEKEGADGTCTVIKRPRSQGDHLEPRPPIVTVMGHVDHGKTTLLDFIRKTNITAREAGGITQHIGASTVMHDGKEIVFLDTPGHEAFTSMRARGAQATDIAILVVAADDGVMPQTREAINHAKAAGVPIIVAINKIDKPAAKPDRVRQQLSDIGLVPEEWGGNTIMVEVSAKSGQGIPQLLEMILLVAEMEELKADPTVKPRGVVVEAKLDKGKGPVATVLVQEGTLCKGDILLFDTACGKIRAMIDSEGKMIDCAGPSTPVEILGLATVPQPGELFTSVENERIARDALSSREQVLRNALQGVPRKLSLEDLYSQLKEGDIPQLNLVLKCDVQGSSEALAASLEKMATNEVGINIVHRGVGRIAESDVMLASASNAVIIGFNVRPDANAKKIAEAEGVQIRLYNIIYDAIDDVKAALEGMLKPTIKENTIGQAEIRQVIKVPKAGKIAGSYVLEGVIRRNAKVRLIRSGIVLWDGSLSNLRRFKDDAKEVAAGYECGISLSNYQDFEEGDILEAYEIVEEKRHLS